MRAALPTLRVPVQGSSSGGWHDRRGARDCRDGRHPRRILAARCGVGHRRHPCDGEFLHRWDLPLARSGGDHDARLPGRGCAVGNRALRTDHAGTAVLGIAFWAYVALHECGPAQATLGKRMLRLRVTGLDGARVSLLTASFRSWPRWLPGILGVIGVLDAIGGLAALAACIAVAFTRRKQGLHDMMARCLVVRRPPPVL